MADGNSGSSNFELRHSNPFELSQELGEDNYGP